MVIRHPSLTIEEMLELVCQSVREVAGSSRSPKTDDAKELTEQEFKALTMRVVHIATANTLPTDAMAAIAKALGTLIGVTAQRPDCNFEDLLRWAQNALVAFARDAGDAATCSRGRRAPNLWLIAPYILLSYFEIIGIVCSDGATDGAG